MKIKLIVSQTGTSPKCVVRLSPGYYLCTESCPFAKIENAHIPKTYNGRNIEINSPSQYSQLLLRGTSAESSAESSVELVWNLVRNLVRNLVFLEKSDVCALA